MQSLLHLIAHILLDRDQNPVQPKGLRDTLVWRELDHLGKWRQCAIMHIYSGIVIPLNLDYQSIDPAEPGADLEQWIDDLRKAYKEAWVGLDGSAHTERLYDTMDKILERSCQSNSK